MCFYDKSFWDILCGLDINAIIAMMSVIIAGTALWVSIRGDKRNEKKARLSVQPLLKIIAEKQWKPSLGDPNRIEQLDLKIINQGLGPAIIKNFILQFDGKELTRNDQDSHFRKAQEKLRGQGGEDAKLSFLAPDSVIQEGDNKLLLWIEYDSVKYNTDGIAKLDILVEYYSIYKDETFNCSTKDIRIRKDSKSQ